MEELITQNLFVSIIFLSSLVGHTFLDIHKFTEVNWVMIQTFRVFFSWKVFQLPMVILQSSYEKFWDLLVALSVNFDGNFQLFRF